MSDKIKLTLSLISSCVFVGLLIVVMGSASVKCDAYGYLESLWRGTCTARGCYGEFYPFVISCNKGNTACAIEIDPEGRGTNLEHIQGTAKNPIKEGGIFCIQSHLVLGTPKQNGLDEIVLRWNEPNMRRYKQGKDT